MYLYTLCVVSEDSRFIFWKMFMRSEDWKIDSALVSGDNCVKYDNKKKERREKEDIMTTIN